VTSTGRIGYPVVWRATLAALLLTTAGCSHQKPDSYKPSYRGARIVELGDIEFDDGDTFDLRGETIRVLGIDTPEIAHPDLGVFENQPYGIAASESTRAWMTRAGTLEIVFGGRGMYDRRLAHVFIDGELLSCRLIRNGLAYETVSHFGDSGFPDLAQEILDTSRNSPKPPFEQPYKWKKRQRTKGSR
jgi:endonuclease YncB( thermonuclease family)